MAGADFDTLILTMVAAAVAAGASAIKVRSHLVGARIWTLVADDGRHMGDPQPLGCAVPGIGTLRAQFSVAPKSHARLITHVGGRHGAATALILPTVLRMVDAKYTPRSAL